jgi:hypothetical protein
VAGAATRRRRGFPSSFPAVAAAAPGFPWLRLDARWFTPPLALRTPDSNICLRPVPGADAASIGFAIDQMIAAPGDRGVLFDSVRGLFLLAADDKITQLESRGGQFTRALARQRAAGGD